MLYDMKHTTVWLSFICIDAVWLFLCCCFNFLFFHLFCIKYNFYTNMYIVYTFQVFFAFVCCIYIPQIFHFVCFFQLLCFPLLLSKFMINKNLFIFFLCDIVSMCIVQSYEKYMNKIYFASRKYFFFRI